MAHQPEPQINPHGRRPPYRQLADILRARVQAGEWGPDQPLPSIVQLQQQYDVARNTAVKAIRVLVAEGLVDVEPRRGTYVKPNDSESD